MGLDELTINGVKYETGLAKQETLNVVFNKLHRDGEGVAFTNVLVSDTGLKYELVGIEDVNGTTSIKWWCPYINNIDSKLGYAYTKIDDTNVGSGYFVPDLDDPSVIVKGGVVAELIHESVALKSDLPTDYSKQGNNPSATNTDILNKIDGITIPTDYAKESKQDWQYNSLNATVLNINLNGAKQGEYNDVLASIQSILDTRLGKLKVVSEASTMAVDATTFPTSSIVLCHNAVTISSVAKLTYEVVFVVDANVAFTVPAGIPTMGEADSTKRREFSFLDGALVVGNFE